MARFTVPEEFRAFMREVAAKIDWIDDRATLLGEDALQHECGRGGRIGGGDAYRFTYFARDGHGRWEIELREQQIRDVAAGLLAEIDGRELEPGSRVTRGEPLLVWGEYPDDMLRVRSLGDLAVVLDGLQAVSAVDPMLIRLWSTADEQVVAALCGLDCALYAVNGDTYGTSVGDPARTGAFELVDDDVGACQVPSSHCVPWAVARAALLHFAENGVLGDGVQLDGTIPTHLLVLGDADRAAELSTRPTPAVDPALTSLPRKAPHGAWADRLLGSLVDLQLAELDTSIRDAICARTALLLIRHGDAAQDSAETAQVLAKELAKVRGVGALFATAGDLQIALRRTQDAPTQPVEVPFT
jgi:hypothetical protein